LGHHRNAAVTTSTTTLRTFSAVDAGPDPTELIAALDEQAALPSIQRLRAAAFDMLRTGRGDAVVDVGCGTGDVVRALASIVGAGGRVVGIDASWTMVVEAQRRIDASNVELLVGDAERLDLEDATFDAALSERVLQHVSNPERAVAELARVTKPGGRIVVIDTDWGMHAVHGADPRLTARVVECWRDNAANGLSGRRLPSLLADAGLRDTAVLAETMTSIDQRRPTAAPFTTMATLAERCGAITPGSGAEWLAQLADAGNHGRFFWAVTMFAAAGTRP
jgi:SAM-dependent methyltransferase